MTKTETLEDLLRTIVIAICRRKPEPRIWSDFSTAEETLCVEVSNQDYGKIIGKKGRGFWAISTIIWYASSDAGSPPTRLKVLETAQRTANVQPNIFRVNKEWDRKLISGLVDKILKACFSSSDGPQAYAIEEGEEGEATVRVQLSKYLQMSSSDPSFEEAASLIIHAAGMSNGVVLKTEVSWK